jgi:hypothetical protein
MHARNVYFPLRGGVCGGGALTVGCLGGLCTSGWLIAVKSIGMIRVEGMTFREGE